LLARRGYATDEADDGLIAPQVHIVIEVFEAVGAQDKALSCQRGDLDHAQWLKQNAGADNGMQWKSDGDEAKA
jgi:hypothetical protein